MKYKITLILSTLLFLTITAFSATPDDNDGDAKQTLTVNNETIDRTVCEIRLDGNNAVLLFTDSTTLTADMRLVSLTMSYDETTGINRLHMTDKYGDVKIFDLQGRRVANSPKQKVFIKNGKKVINKKK